MSENPFDKPDLTNWAFDPDTYADTAGAVPAVPDDNRRLNGWSNSVPDEPSPSHANFLFREALRDLAWLEGRYPRHFTRLDEAIAATSTVGRLFYVDRDAIPALLAGATHVGDTGDAIQQIVTDGERIYSVDVTGQVRAFTFDDPLVAAELWSVNPEFTGDAATRIWTDGHRVYVHQTDSAADPNIFALNRDTGATVADDFALAIDATPGSICSTGAHVAAIAGAAFRDLRIAESDLVSPSTVASAWHSTTGAFIKIIASAGARLVAEPGRICAIGSLTGSNHQIKVFDFTGTVIWGYAFPTPSGTLDMRDIASDGERVYVCYESRGDLGSADSNIAAFSITTGEVLWSRDAGDLAEDARAVATDGETVLVLVNDGGTEVNAILLDARLGHELARSPGVVAQADSPLRSIACDGLRYYLPSADDIVTLERRTPARQYQRVSGQDPERAPFFQLALPLR